MARTIYGDTKYVMFECGPGIRQMFQMGDRWVEENDDKFIEQITCVKDDCLGEWFMYIYYRDNEDE